MFFPDFSVRWAGWAESKDGLKKSVTWSCSNAKKSTHDIMAVSFNAISKDAESQEVIFQTIDVTTNTAQNLAIEI